MPGSGTGVPATSPTPILYATLDQFKLWAFSRSDEATNADGDSYDDLLEDILEAVSRQMDRDCGRRFYRTTAEARLSRVGPEGSVRIVDAIAGAAITIEVDADGDDVVETTLTTSQYRMEPLTEDDGGPVLRYQTIRSRPGTDYFGSGVASVFSPGRLVRTTTDWGYVNVDGTPPAPIRSGCIVMTARVWARREARLGVVTIPDMAGTVAVLTKTDPDYLAAISGYIHKRGPKRVKVA